MKLDDLLYYYNKFKFGEDNFHNLMKNRVREVLLISSLFDAYVLEQDGRLSEQIYGQYSLLNLSTAPRITTVNFTDDAIEIIKNKKFDLVIIMMRIGGTTPFDLASQIKKIHPELPLLLLLNKQSYIDVIEQKMQVLHNFDEVFLWNGDTKLFLAMIKSVEDRLNVDSDTVQGNVRVILLVENSISYYSQFLPLFYSVGLKTTQELIEAELNQINVRLRMRARPKILMVHNYEEAIEIFHKYKNNLLCVITNVNLPRNGKIDEMGGVKLIREIRDQNSHIPVLIQSSELRNEVEARKLKAEFIHKYSKRLMHDVRDFVRYNLGFGDFIFRDLKNRELRRAKNVYQMEKILAKIPEESILYHGEHNHFSAWMIAHNEYQIAEQIRPMETTDFFSTEEIRKFLVATIRKVRHSQYRGKVIDYEPGMIPEEQKIIRLADGSLGGKGRGLAFLNALLVTMELNKEFVGTEIKLPITAIIGTNEFDNFIDQNNIETNRLLSMSDEEIDKYFMACSISAKLKKKLSLLLDSIALPLAVRSSGLLEDSQSQPFAGIYRTFMLPNNHTDKAVRVQQLANAIKCVFASPFFGGAKKYIESINYKIEEEKMAVIIQVIAGSKHRDNLYYPEFSGTAQSYNFYPISNMKHSDGIASLAVGLGKSVVDGGRSFRFCPSFPRINLLEPVGIVENNQRKFYGLDLNINGITDLQGEDSFLVYNRIKNIDMQETFKEMTSVWDYENFEFIDGDFAKGPRVLTFRNQIYYETFPLAALLRRILEIGEMAIGVPVEIEYAICLTKSELNPVPSFYLLQIRPLSVNKEEIDIKLDEINSEDILLYTQRGIGNGKISHIKDIVYIDPEEFDNTKTMEMILEIEKLNEKIKKTKSKYLLIGPGRWGSSDRFLGIPVRWAQINCAKVIVETSLEKFSVEASQGSHFFHNIVAMEVGYLTVNHNSETGKLDWDWLKKQKVAEKLKYAFHIKLEQELSVKIDGRSGNSVIYKSGEI